MKCPVCKGVGAVGAKQETCLYCRGTGKVIMTRYDHIQDYSLDELAELLAFWWCRAVICTDGDLRKADQEERTRYFTEWLREPHEV